MGIGPAGIVVMIIMALIIVLRLAGALVTRRRSRSDADGTDARPTSAWNAFWQANDDGHGGNPGAHGHHHGGHHGGSHHGGGHHGGGHHGGHDGGGHVSGGGHHG